MRPCRRVCLPPPTATLEESPSEELLSFTSHRSILVDKEDGSCVTTAVKASVTIEEATVVLPTGPVPFLGICTRRFATALVCGPAGSLQSLAGRPAIVFAHGFSQRPGNYSKLLRTFAANGYIVVAPRTWLFDVIWPFVKVETVDNTFALPEKLQTALLIDTARALKQIKKAGTGDVHLCGHSMGGAMALSYLGRTPVCELKSAFFFAPDVKRTKITDLNPYVGINEDGGEGLGTLASEMAPIDILVLHGKKDVIVDEEDIGTLYEKMSAKSGLTGVGEMIEGSHIGFENSLKVDSKLLNRIFGNWVTKLFLVLDFILYGPFDPFGLDTREQLALTKRTCIAWLENVGKDDTVKTAVEAASDRDEIEYKWQGSPFLSPSIKQSVQKKETEPVQEEPGKTRVATTANTERFD